VSTVGSTGSSGGVVTVTATGESLGDPGRSSSATRPGNWRPISSAMACERSGVVSVTVTSMSTVSSTGAALTSAASGPEKPTHVMQPKPAT